MTTTYTAQQVIISWGSDNLTPGALSEGTFAEVATTARRASQTGLMGGDGVIALMSNTTGTVTVTLSAASDVNDRLSEALQQQIDDGTPVARPLQLKDHSGRTVVSSPKAVIDGYPTITYSENVPTYAWVFLCPRLSISANGSNNL